MKKYLSMILALLVLVSLAGCQEAAPVATVPELLEPVSANLDTATAELGDVFTMTYYKGEVVPYVQSLYFEENGVIGNLYVQEGDLVKEGQLLAKLDNSKLLSKISAQEEKIAHQEKLAKFSDDTAQADIDIAKAELEILRESGATVQKLAVKETEIQQLELNLKQTKELRKLDMDELYLELEELKAQLINPDITAPFSGRVVYIAASIGKEIKATKPMFVLADDSRSYIACDTLQESSIKSAVSMQARILGEEAPITYVPWDSDPYITDMTNAGATLLFSWGGETPLRCGDFVTILLMFERVENVLCIPKNALYRDTDGYYVYKIEGEQQVRCVVKPGLMSSTRVEILEGLQEGDVVNVQG